MTRVLLVSAALVLCQRPALADEPAPSNRRRAGAVAAAAVPGLIVHGSGHYVLGERRTAKRLLVLQGVGLGVAAIGGVPLLVSGASARLSLPTVPLAVAGISTFLLGWIADIYGSAGASRVAGTRDSWLPALELDAGYALVDDAQFDYRSFAVVGGRVRWRRLELRPRAWVATAADNQRLSTDLAYRWRADDGSHLEVGAATSFHEHGEERFDVLGLEGFVAGRVELARIGPTLRGAFAGLLVGAGSERIAYDDLPHDWNGNLLGRFGFGVYLGDSGEIEAYYDHRRDDYAGGLALARGGGFLGHFGLRGHIDVVRPWGLAWQLERGSANVARLAVRYRWGGR